jgi:hypothetical protein
VPLVLQLAVGRRTPGALVIGLYATTVATAVALVAAAAVSCSRGRPPGAGRGGRDRAIILA